MVKARLSGRNYINSSDVQDSFVSFDIEKVYGAPSSPNWIPFSNTDKTLSCLEVSGVALLCCVSTELLLQDSVVNLVSLAEQENSFIQPGDVTLTTKWLSSSGDIGWQLRNYFTAICHAVVDKDEDVRRAALVDIRTNGQIGPVVEWFYSFGFFLLRKDTSYSCLPLWGLDLIEALESNYLGPLSASELQVSIQTHNSIVALGKPQFSLTFGYHNSTCTSRFSTNSSPLSEIIQTISHDATGTMESRRAMLTWTNLKL